MQWCSFTNSQKFEDFLVSLESSVYLTRLYLCLLKFEEEAVLNERLLNIIKYSPLKKLELKVYSSYGTIVDMKTLKDFFNGLNNGNLEYIFLSLWPQIHETPSKDQVANLKHSFTEFLKNQAATLYSFYVFIDFTDSENALRIAPFTHIPEFIKTNKEKIEEYERFDVRIIRSLF